MKRNKNQSQGLSIHIQASMTATFILFVYYKPSLLNLNTGPFRSTSVNEFPVIASRNSFTSRCSAVAQRRPSGFNTLCSSFISLPLSVIIWSTSYTKTMSSLSSGNPVSLSERIVLTLAIPLFPISFSTAFMHKGLMSRA